jgi:hypothetical protein
LTSWSTPKNRIVDLLVNPKNRIVDLLVNPKNRIVDLLVNPKNRLVDLLVNPKNRIVDLLVNLKSVKGLFLLFYERRGCRSSSRKKELDEICKHFHK